MNIGNSRVAFCRFAGEKLKERAAFPVDASSKTILAGLASFPSFQSGGICSVNPVLESRLLPELKKNFPVSWRRVRHDVPLGIEIRCRHPETVGTDRLVIARAAWEKFRSKCLAIDLGTAATLNFISAEGEFLGGAISAGFGLVAKSLNQGTAQLPSVELKPPKSILGQDTQEAIQSGVHFGMIGLVEKWIELGKKEIGREAKVMITGGDLERIRSAVRADEYDPDLIHQGIRSICLA